MKNKNSSRFFKWLWEVVPKAIAVFAIGTGAFYVYAAVTFPGTAPAPVTGVVGQFAGLSAEGYDGDVTNYASLNNKCRMGSVLNPMTGIATTNLGAHVCSAMEIINSYNFASPVIAAQATGTGIVNSGPPGFTVFANDCNGWQVREATFQGSPAFASVWSFSDRSGSLSACNAVFDSANVRVACCR